MRPNWWRRQESGDRRQEGAAGLAGFVAWLSPLRNRKAASWGGFFFSYSISSEYHTERINRPNIIEGIRV
jgi:hypothetical protein